MPALLALIPLLVQSAPALIQAGIDVAELIQKIAAHLKQSGELTPEEEVQLDAHIADVESKDWWKVQD